MNGICTRNEKLELPKSFIKSTRKYGGVSPQLQPMAAALGGRYALFIHRRVAAAFCLSASRHQLSRHLRLLMWPRGGHSLAGRFYGRPPWRCAVPVGVDRRSLWAGRQVRVERTNERTPVGWFNFNVERDVICVTPAQVPPSADTF